MSFPRYPAYKDSGVEWLGDVPSEWTVERFDKHAYTHRLSVTPDQLAGQDVLHYSIPSIQETGSGSVEDGTSIDSNKLVINQPQLLVSKLNPHKQVVVLARPHGELLTVSSTEFVPLVAITAKSEYMRYVWQSSVCLDYLLARCDSATRSHQRVSPDDISKVMWSWPSEAEQNQIASFLDHETEKIDALVAEQERLIELLKEKRQAVISHAVTKGLDPSVPLKDSGVEWLGEVPAHWGVGKCGFYLRILNGFAFPSTGFTDDESAHRLLRGANVGVSRLKWDDTVYWQRSSDDGLDEYEMAEGDLVMGMDRPLISEGMRVAKVSATDLPSLLLQRVASLKVGPNLHVDYLHYLLASEMFVAHFSPETTGVSVPHISPDQINNFVIPIPPISEQTKISEHVQRATAMFGGLIDEAENAIRLLQERRTALVSAAVTGQIDVRGWVPAEAVA